MSGELQRGLSSTTSDPTAAPPVASTGNPLSRVVSPEGPPPALEPHAVQPAAKVGGTVGGSSLYEVATPEGPPPPLGGTGAGGHEGGEEDDGEPRAAWGSRTEFILMTVGYAVGLGNVWRFPYLCYQNGGGAFLIPYVVCLFLLGMQLMLLELAIGQIFRKGPFHSLQKVDPRLAGVGWAALICAVLVASYYNMVIAWALYYFFSSLASPLPWDHSVAVGQSGGHQNSTYFWKHNALGMSDTSAADGHSPDRFDIGGINWHMLLMLALVCVMCWGAVLRGVETSGKAVYVTSTAPYFFLTILVVRGVTLDGASDGIQFYLFGEVDESGVHRLSFDKLASIEVWQTAASQIFYSLGVGFGSLIAFGSYNPKDEVGAVWPRCS
jgi:SNF family Na+-dependent transporter